MYLGCDWENVPLHLPSTFTALAALPNSPEVRVGMLGEFGLTWPWESLHVEALAWYDHWLKGHDTGILDGTRRSATCCPAADEWRTADAGHRPRATHRGAGACAPTARSATTRATPGRATYLVLGRRTGPGQAERSDRPARQLTWTTAPLDQDLDVVGDIELRARRHRHRRSTRPGSSPCQDVAPDGTVDRRHRRLAARQPPRGRRAASRPARPCCPAARPRPCPSARSSTTASRWCANARRFAAGHRIRLVLTSDDQDPTTPAIMSFRHASVGTSSLNTIHSSSRLLLPSCRPPETPDSRTTAPLVDNKVDLVRGRLGQTHQLLAMVHDPRPQLTSRAAGTMLVTAHAPCRCTPRWRAARRATHQHAREPGGLLEMWRMPATGEQRNRPCGKVGARRGGAWKTGQHVGGPRNAAMPART